jgi:hypothetical protein
MKKRNVTISMPADLFEELRRVVGPGDISKFITELILKTLKDRHLKQDYIDSNHDKQRIADAEAWEALDDKGWE